LRNVLNKICWFAILRSRGTPEQRVYAKEMLRQASNAIRELCTCLHLKDEMPGSDRTIYTAHWQEGFTSGCASRQTSNGLCNSHHQDKLCFYMGDNPTNLNFLVNVMNEAFNANYQCRIQIADNCCTLPVTESCRLS
jgi:hypothetical protein